jgi:TP901 family phage tail tape measure protein
MIVRDLLIKLGFKSDTSALNKTEKQIGGLKSQIGTLQVAAGQMLANLAQQGISKIADTLKEGVDQSVQFGREMANISSLIGGDQMRTKELAADVDRMALQFGKGTSEINDGLYDLIGTLGDSAEATAQLELAMKLGAAGAATTKDGISILAAVTKAYGDTSMETMQRVADMSTKTVNLGKITMPELASSIGLVTPLAAQLGVTIEEVMANTATLTGVTGSGSEVMTQMASAMRALIDRSKPMEAAFQKAFKPIGIKTMKDAIQRFGFVGTMQKLVDTTDGTMEGINALFGRIEGLKEALSVTGNQAQDFQTKLAAMGNVAGEVDAQYKAQTTGLGAAGFAMDKAKAQSDALSRQIGERMTPAFLALEDAGLVVKQLFADYLLPLFEQVATTSTEGGSNIQTFAIGFRVLTAVLIDVVGIIDTLLTGLRQVFDVVIGVTKAFYRLFQLDFAGAGTAIADVARNYVATTKGLVTRATGYGNIIGGALDFSTMQERAAVGAGGMGRGSEINTNVGGVNITVNAAPGTEAAAATRELDTVARAVWDQNLVQAQAALAGDY